MRRPEVRLGIGIVYVLAPTPTPPSHVLGGKVPTPRVEGFSAAQNIQPSIAMVVPGILEATLRTKVPVELWSDDANRPRAAPVRRAWRCTRPTATGIGRVDGNRIAHDGVCSADDRAAGPPVRYHRARSMK